MGLLPEIGYPQTGDKAESGFYVCMNCNETNENENSTIHLDKPKKLPKCPICGHTYWMKF